jgi:hypothetical protein
MSYKTIISYTKPNAEIALHTPAVEFLNLIDTYFDAGKVTQKPVLVEDGLNSTYTTIFDSEADHLEFIDEVLNIANSDIRETYCSDNSITYVIEEGAA